MATPERDTVYTKDASTRAAPARESNSTGWFVGIIVALALLAIGYLVFSANSGPTAPATTVDVNNSPAITAPADTTPAPVTDTTTTPAVTAPADTTTPAPMAADPVAPATVVDPPAVTTDPAPVTTEPAPVQ
jgi:hypothetical protein